MNVASCFNFLGNHFSDKSNWDVVSYFTFLRNHFSEKTNFERCVCGFWRHILFYTLLMTTVVVKQNLFMSTKVITKRSKKSKIVKQCSVDIFIEKNYFESSRKNFDTNKTVIEHIAKNWNLHLLDMIDNGININN